MSKIYVDLVSAKSTNSKLTSTSSSINTTKDNINRLVRNMDPSIQGLLGIGKRLNELNKETAFISNNVNNLHSGINDYIDRYNNLENSLIDEASQIKGSGGTGISVNDFNAILNLDRLTPLGPSSLVNYINNVLVFNGVLGVLSNIQPLQPSNLLTLLNMTGAKDISGNTSTTGGESEWDIQVTSSLNLVDGENKLKKEKTIGENEVPNLTKVASFIDVEAKKEKSLLEYENNYDGAYGHGEVSAKVGTGEVHAGASMGLYKVGEDGEEYFAPGISAEAGVSATAVSLSASGVLGSDDLGLYGKGSVDVGKAEAKGELAVGFTDDGIKAKVSGDAELVLVEAEGSAGVTVLGAEMGVKGGVKVGVGANVDVGYEDGKFSFDVGASLGVGFDVGIEVDIGALATGTVNAVTGTVDAVSGAAESVWNNIKGWF